MKNLSSIYNAGMNSTHPPAQPQAALPWYYAPLLALLLPIALLRLLWKSRKNPAYRQHIGERLARRLPAPQPDTLWAHTVSVGEFLAIRPLLTAWLADNPTAHLLLTTTTPTGRAQLQRLQNQHPARITIRYLPYDLPAFIRRFLRHTQPRAIILMETEIWPALISEAAKKNIPVLLTNARLSARSLRRYRRFAQPLLAPLLDHLHINAQTRDDARRFRHLGFRHIRTTPSLKYLPPAAAEAAPFPAAHPIILAASTHDSEETAILTAYQTLRRSHPDARLILAPRHPERRDNVCAVIRAAGLRPILRSQHPQPTHPDDIYLIDTLGELPAYFARADLAYIGGTLINRGGHNLLEPLHARTPVIYGFSTYNFAHIARELRQQPFARQIQNADQLAAAMQSLLATDPHTLRTAIDHHLAPYENLLAQHLNIINQIFHKNSDFLSS
ncbi:MAG: 3-deoxy-D-manno-octulosonic acid transferase [Cardiobacteriaceae bacterium]|nr:3-deoxy-D-manno-octulosonic acid transferase [Cardiobacteriaceae bacterium]